ncbi:MAG: serine--tRNA ligase [Bdellovibrionota bacterium]|jgi:seryl-tRNA synthetase
MLDINRIRENPEAVKNALLKRMDSVDFTNLLKEDAECRKLLQEVEGLKARRNKVSADIPRLKKEGKDISSLMDEMKEVGESIKSLDARCATLQDSIRTFMESLPNVPADDVLPGNKENNKVVKTFGEKPTFSFKAKDHIEIAQSLKLIDYERGVKLGGNGFWIYQGEGARLEWALLQYFIDQHIKDGYTFMLLPHILNWQSGITAGQFPKFVDDVFTLTGAEDKEHTQFLLPTAETALINLYRDEIIPEAELPKKLFGYTPCYRKEAGSYRAAERGMIRGHQFNKVEMFAYCLPEDSDKILDELIAKASALVEGLGLHYRVSKLAAGDCSASMAKTFDVEVWIPSMNEYKEVSSASNAHDYQARRGNIRYKQQASGKNLFVHTLNASGLATSRLFPAILEQFQQEDGSVVVPEVLRKWVGRDQLTL